MVAARRGAGVDAPSGWQSRQSRSAIDQWAQLYLDVEASKHGASAYARKNPTSTRLDFRNCGIDHVHTEYIGSTIRRYTSSNGPEAWLRPAKIFSCDAGCNANFFFAPQTKIRSSTVGTAGARGTAQYLVADLLYFPAGLAPSDLMGAKYGSTTDLQADPINGHP